MWLKYILKYSHKKLNFKQVMEARSENSNTRGPNYAKAVGEQDYMR